MMGEGEDGMDGRKDERSEGGKGEGGKEEERKKGRKEESHGRGSRARVEAPRIVLQCLFKEEGAVRVASGP